MNVKYNKCIKIIQLKKMVSQYGYCELCEVFVAFLMVSQCSGMFVGCSRDWKEKRCKKSN